MPEHSYTSRRELDQYVFHPAVTLLAPLCCILLQVILPRIWPRLAILDLPLVAVVYFAIARRSPVAGTVTGTLIGLFQDGLSRDPFGVNGIAKAIVGYGVASLTFAVDADIALNRLLLNFFASLLQSALLFLIGRYLLGDPTLRTLPLHELVRALCNAGVALPIFFLLDRFRVRE